MARTTRKWPIGAAIALALVVATVVGFHYWPAPAAALPTGIASGSGQIASKAIDVSSRLPLEVAEVLVAEGDLVQPGQIVARMKTVTLESELAEATEKVAAAREQVAVARSAIVRQKSEIELAAMEKERSRKLVEASVVSEHDYEQRTMTLATSEAGFDEQKAKLEVAELELKVAEANVATIHTRIDDATLTSPVFGRVAARVAEPGEVVAAGGKVLAIVDLDDVYLEVLLPAEQGAAIRVGADARFTLPRASARVTRGRVAVVSPQVEPRGDTVRVKIRVPPALVRADVDGIRPGVRGVGYVKVDDDAVWPAWLDTP